MEKLEDRSLLAAVVPPSGIVSWWTGDNTTADLVGPNNATLFNGGAFATGQVAAGFNFDGIDDHLQATTVGLPTGSADRTIELWARIDQPVANEAFFASYGAPGAGNQVYTLGSVSDGRVFVSTWGPAITGPVLQNNRWYHVAATNVGTSFKLYLDGVEVGAGIMAVNTPADSTFWMGRQTMTAIGDGRRLDGMVDEVSVYNRALSGAEIQSIYGAGTAGKVKGNYIKADIVAVPEGPAGSTTVATFTISRNGDLASAASVNWATSNGTALAVSDYVAASGTAVFPINVSETTVEITVNGDDTKEPKESFNLVLSGATPGYAVGGGQATILNDDFLGLVSHWTGNNTTADAKGLNHGSLVNGATYEDGQVLQGFSLDGVNDGVKVADSASLKLTESLTIEAWVRADALPVQHAMIFFRGDDRGGLDPYWLSVESDGQLRFTVEALGSAAGVGTTMPLGQMVHVVGTLDDATGALRLYLNGVLKSQTITAVRPFGDLDSANNPGIGIGNHGGFPDTWHNFPFAGLIDEVKVYDQALTSTEVLANFHATKGDLVPTISISDATVTESDPAFPGQPLVPPDGNGLSAARTLLIGPDGKVYVASHDTNSVKIFADGTGEYLGELTTPGGELQGPWSMAFGPDDMLYVGGRYSRNIVRFDIVSGAAEVFVTAADNGQNMSFSLAFGPDGNLYSSSRVEGAPSAQGTVRHYAAATGAYLGDFVTANSGGLVSPYGIAFGPDDNLYVSSAASQEIKRYDGQSGLFLENFVGSGSGGLTNASQIVFHDGQLYVASQSNLRILRYDALTGAFVDVYASGLGITPAGLAFSSSGELYVSLGTGVLTSGSSVIRIVQGLVPLTLSLSYPGEAPISVNYATLDSSASAGSDYVAASGSVVFPAGVTTQTVYIPLLDDAALESTETYSVSLSGPTGGAIVADGNATVTILDDEATRQISISDTTAIAGSTAAHFRGTFLEGNNGDFIQLAFHNGIAYVGTGSNSIRRYDAFTAAFIDTLVPAGTINGVRDIRFQGNYIYVGSEYSDEVLRFDAVTGAPAGVAGAPSAVFVAAGSGVDGTHGMTFGPDSNGDLVPELYVSGRNSHNVVRYDGATGLPLGTYVTTGSGGLAWPEGITFDPTGTTLLVSNAGGGSNILKYNAQTGAYLGVAASTGLQRPLDVKFGPDGLMYVASADNDRVVRFQPNGTYFDDYVPAGAGGMDNPYRVHFGPDGNVYVTNLPSKNILRFGTESEAVFTVTLAGPNSQPVSVDFATAEGTAFAGSDYLSTSGTVVFAPGSTSRTILVPVLGNVGNELAETFSVILSGQSAGAWIMDGQGIGTILPPTKFYVVDDGTANRTYEYGVTGNSIEDYSVDSGNSTPRGAASNAAGDKVWVIDGANKNVYVYGATGNLLGSWAATATGLSQPEGIATNGTDIWIVDASADKVFKFGGAASRLSGTQNSPNNASFKLNSGNKDAKDVVTDGVHLWVVNGTTTDKVFKYTVGGSFVGSWTISTSGATSPTGITLDPSNPSHLWIVDSGTKRVYQYDAAVSRTSGSQAASTSFALAAANTNPQGIADPPVAGVPTSEPVEAAPTMAGVLATSTVPRTPQSSVYTQDQAEIYLSPAVIDTSRRLTNPRWLKAAVNPAVIDAPTSSSHDEAIGSIADELERLIPVRKIKR